MLSGIGASRLGAPPRHTERGMVTVELAVGLITVALLTVVLASVVLLGITQASAARASTEIARQLARGDQQAADRAREATPDGSRIDVERSREGVSVSVVAPVRIIHMGSFTLTAEAFAVWEPGAGP